MKKNNLIKYLFTVLIILGINLVTFSQDKISVLEKQLAQTRNSIKSVENKSEQVLTKLKLINAEIKIQKELLVAVQANILRIETKISENKKSIAVLNNDIFALKSEYEELIYYAYKTKDIRAKTVYIMSAENFNKAYKRFVYLQYFTEYIEQTTTDLAGKQEKLEAITNELNAEYAENIALKEKESDAIISLKKQQQDQNVLIVTLKYKKSFLEAQLKTKQIAAQALRNSVETQKMTDNSDTKSSETIDFEKLKGKYLIPVSGTITAYFGIQKHPVLENVQIINDGLEITVNNNPEVKVIADGIVSKVVSIPGANKAIIVKHGDYYSVYSNLNDIYVSTGQKITKNKIIGNVFVSENNSNSGVLNFQIWYKRTKLDPKDWIN